MTNWITAELSVLHGMALLIGFSLSVSALGINLIQRYRFLDDQDPALRLSAAFGIGAGLFSIVLFMLGCMGFVGFIPSAGLFLVVILIGISGGYRILFEEIKSLAIIEPEQSYPKWVCFLLILLGATSISYFILSAAPPTVADALKCHLNYCRYYIYNGTIQHYPSARHSGIPFLAQTLYLWGLTLGSERFAGMLCWFTGIMLTLAIFGYAKRFGGTFGGILAASLFYFMPVTMLNSISPMVDLYVAFYASLSLLIVISAHASKISSILKPAMMLAGFAAACKTNGLFLIPPMFFLLMIKFRKDFNLFKRLLPAIILYLICMLPMYIRTWIWTGNPFYPVAFPLSDTISIFSRFKGISAHIGTQYFQDRSLLKMFYVPFQLVFNPEALSKSRWIEGSGITPSTLGLLPAGILGGGSLTALPFISSFLFQIMVYLSGGLSSRFFWPCEPAVSAGVGGGLGLLLRRDRKKRLIIPIMFVLLLSIGQTGYITYLYGRNMFPVVFGIEKTNHYLSRTTPFFDTWQWINRSLPRNAIICSAFSATYYLRQPHVFLGDLAGVYPYLSDNDSTRLLLAFKKNHIDYLILGQEHLQSGTATKKLVDLGYLIPYKFFPGAIIGYRSPVSFKCRTKTLMLYRIKWTSTGD